MELLGAIIEFIAALFLIAAEITIHLFVLLFVLLGDSYYRKGLARLLTLLACIPLVYLAIGWSSLWVFPAFWEKIAPYYSNTSFVISCLLIFLFLSAATAAQFSTEGKEIKETIPSWIRHIIAYILAFGIVFIGLHYITGTAKRVSLTERGCNFTQTHLSDEQQEKGRKLLNSIGGLLGKETEMAEKIPCDFLKQN